MSWFLCFLFKSNILSFFWESTCEDVQCPEGVCNLAQCEPPDFFGCIENESPCLGSYHSDPEYWMKSECSCTECCDIRTCGGDMCAGINCQLKICFKKIAIIRDHNKIMNYEKNYSTFFQTKKYKKSK